MSKKRILFVNEFSGLSTGYATIGLELLKRFHATGKYELCELGCAVRPDDARINDVPWKYINVMPHTYDKDVFAQFNKDKKNEFGAMAFEPACVQFKPDVVLAIRDAWMDSFIRWSPFRRFYRFGWMPTCDAYPQHSEWLDLMADADGLFTYSDWATEVIKGQTNGFVRPIGSAPPGADLDTFKVFNKRSHRARMGLRDDTFIVGTVARNQKRKLFPDLMEGFALFLEQADKELVDKTFLYLHTSWPDLGWDIPGLLAEHGLGHKTLFTYVCRACGHVFVNFFHDSRTPCVKCNQYAAEFPNAAVGISRAQLCDVYNVFDAYIQFSLAEGQGMPQVEAAACGVPVMAVNYSAMADVVRKLGGYPIKVQRFFKESETGRKMALPDLQDLASKLINFLNLPEPIRAKKGWEARKLAEEHYNWDATAAKWMGWFEAAPPERSWDEPPRFVTPNLNIPAGLTNDQFVSWGLVNIAGRPDLVNTYLHSRMVRDLNWGCRIGQQDADYVSELSFNGSRPRREPYGPNEAIKVLVNIAERHNYWEKYRYDNQKTQNNNR